MRPPPDMEARAPRQEPAATNAPDTDSINASTDTIVEADPIEVARRLIEFGVPIFTAAPDPAGPGGGTGGTGYRLPKGWQDTRPDKTILDAWRPGTALCAVMGHGLDLLDCDPRSGGEQSRAGLQGAGVWPRAYAVAATPSGGTHEFIASLNVRSRDGVRAGLDVKAGTAEGGRGFAFIAPTVRKSKTTGELVAYRWLSVPDLDALAEGDDSGLEFAEIVRAAHKPPMSTFVDTPVASGDFLNPSSLDDLEATITRHTRHDAVVKIASALRGSGLTREDVALDWIKTKVWPMLDQRRGGHEYPWTELAGDVHDVFTRYPAGNGTGPMGPTEPSNTLPPLVNLRTFLAEPDPPITYRIDRLMNAGSRTLLAAQHKAGKTTLVGNLLRCLVDGDPFLDVYQVEPVRRVVLIDDELDPTMLRRWLRDHGIVNDHKVDLVSLKGCLSSFEILTPSGRARWAKHLGPADHVVFDCVRPALDALGLSEDKDAGRFLVAFDELLKIAGIGEQTMVHHMGHNGERGRGDSRLLDWPDQLWSLMYTKDAAGDVDRDEPRFFTAYGRDVDQPEQQLGYDAVGRRLSVTGGTRKDAKVDSALEAVLGWLGEQSEAVSGRAIEDGLYSTDHGRNAVRAAVKKGIKGLDIIVEDGPRNAKLHLLNPSSAPVRHTAPPVRQRSESECATPPIGGAHSAHSANPSAPLEDSAHSGNGARPARTYPQCKCGHPIYGSGRDQCGACLKKEMSR